MTFDSSQARRNTEPKKLKSFSIDIIESLKDEPFYIMKIWVDADACPGVIRDILFRAAERTRLPLTLVANSALTVPALKNIRMLQVSSGFDAADDEIVKRVQAGDLVITSDIPLAHEVLQKKAMALSPRGELFSEDNIRNRLVMRDLMDSLRSSGVNTGGPAALSQGDRKTFANQLDRLITRFAQQQD